MSFPTASELYSGRGAALYDEVTRSDTSEIRELLGVIRGSRPSILELAAGSGRLTFPLARVSRSVVAVDSSTELLEILQERLRRHPEAEVVALHKDILEPGFVNGFDELFDIVVLGTTTIALFDKAERESIFRASRALMGKGGRLLVTLYESAASEEERLLLGGKVGVREFRRAGLRHSILTEYDNERALGIYAGTTYDLTASELSAELVRVGFVIDCELPIGVGQQADSTHCLLVASVDQNHIPDSAVAEFFTPVADWGASKWEAVAAEGSWVTFADGAKALCMVSGIWNASLGYGNQAIADAIHEASLHASALPLFRRGSNYARHAAARLIQFAQPASYSTVFFSTSGSAALDASVKLARQFQVLRGHQRKARILSFTGSYHGMTVGAMAVTGEYIHQDLYRIDERLHIKIPHDDPAALNRVMARYGPEIAAVIFEPVLGSGALAVSDEMIDAMLRWRAEAGFLLIADEVATGYYRTGPRFASHDWSEQPDVIITSKALTNGTCAASALLLTSEIVSIFAESGTIFWHGETQAGSPQSCAAILATIAEFERLDVAGSSARVAERLDEFLDRLTTQSDRLSHAGRGCFRAIEILKPDLAPLSAIEVTKLVDRFRDAGLLVQPGPSAIQLIPNLLINDVDLDLAFKIVTQVLFDFLDGGR